MASKVRRWIDRILNPLKHDPAWFELASIMGAIGWAVMGLMSTYDFDDWPSMRFISSYIGSTPLYLALWLGILQGIAVFAGLPQRRAVRLRMVAAFLVSWWWFFLGLGIARTLPGLNPHVALYVVMGTINLMVMGRLMMMDARRDG